MDPHTQKQNRTLLETCRRVRQEIEQIRQEKKAVGLENKDHEARLKALERAVAEAERRLAP